MIAAAALLAAPASPAAAQGTGCPNAAIRAEQNAAHLPECRAYEQVSPVDKNDYAISAGNQAVAPSGSAITYISTGAFAGASGSTDVNQYVSTRSPSGWSTRGITPALTNTGFVAGAHYYGFSPDLSRMFFYAEGTGTPQPPFRFFRRNADGSIEPITPVLDIGGRASTLNRFGGGSADYSRLVFQTPAELTQDSQGLGPGEKLYDWAGGQLSLVSVLPDGTPSVGGLSINPGHAISADGARVYWYASGSNFGAGPVYLSEEGKPSRLVSADQSGAPQTATLAHVATDGSVAYLTSTARLTADASPAGADLYRYDAESGQLTDLTPSSDPGGVAVADSVVGSDDGSHVYFIAEGKLADGATAGQPNLYLWHGGATTFIATLAAREPRRAQNPWRVSLDYQASADGRHLLFRSKAPLQPGYDNAGQDEVYLYDADSGDLTCVSCDPSGAPPSSDAELTGGVASFQVLSPLNNMSADGRRVFFETADPLVRQDTNGTADVYEWEGGQIHLISTGRSPFPSTFLNVTPSGEDALFLTRSQLAGQDADDLSDVYDARVGGGLASQNPPPAAPPCSGDGCRGPAATPPAPADRGSSKFTGPGNPAGGEEDTSKRCTRLDRRADRAKHRAKRAKRAFKRAKRQARRAEGKRAKRLDRKVDRKRDRLKQKRRKARKAKRKVRRCERGGK